MQNLYLNTGKNMTGQIYKKERIELQDYVIDGLQNWAGRT